MVATVTHITSASRSVAYFEQDGYYARGSAQHRRASAWYGRGAAALALPRHVSPRRFHAVLSGQVPGTELRLGRIREGAHEHRPGVDITLSAPKSVSIAALVEGDRRVRRAHDEAVREALDFVEAELLQTRGYDRATGRRPRVRAHDAVFALFRHDTSRNLDPQLHTHAVAANMCRNGQGQWASVEPTALFRNQRLIGAYYRHALARQLRSLGYAIVPTLVGGVPGFELGGYPRAALEAFSTRRRDILAELAQWGVAYTPAQAQRAALYTRARKEEPSRRALLERWAVRAHALGLAVAAPGKRRRRPRPADRPGPRSGLSVLEVVWRAVEHVEERTTVFAAGEVRAVALGHAPGVHAMEDIDAAMARLEREGHLVRTSRRGADLAFVTERALRAERAMVAWMREGAETREALMGHEALEALLDTARLTEGQRDAVRTIVRSRNRLVGVQGSAGAGKTTMLRTVARCIGERRLLGLAPSTGATRVLERETGIEAATLQWFLARYGEMVDANRLAEARREFRGAVVFVDESSMVSTVQMHTLMATAERLELERLVLVGDTRQLRAVEAGEPFRLLQQQGMELAVMDEILRQRDAELLDVVRHAQAGRAGAALEGLGGAVREVAPEALGESAAGLWLALGPSERARTAILAPTHALRAQINTIIRERLVGEGILHGPELEIERLIDRRMTRVQTADIAHYHPGDAVVFHRDAYGWRSGDICAVAGTGEGRVVLVDGEGHSRSFRPSGNASRNLAVCDTALIRIRAGDRIRWTRNRAKGRGRGPRLVNGEEATILGIDSRRVRLRTEHGETTSVLRSDPQLRHLDHAYSVTVHGAQGRTCRAAIGVLDSGHGALATQSTFYVEVSRASERFVLFTDNAEQLVETLETHTGQRRGALEAVGGTAGRPAAGHAAAAAAGALEREWNGVVETAKRRRVPASRVPGYEETVRRAEALSEGPDLPEKWRRFLGNLADGHRAGLERERRIRALLGRVDAHCRAWPTLHREARAEECAPAVIPAHAAWRAEGDALHADARALLDDRLGARHAEAMARAGAGAMARAMEALAAVRLRDEYEALRHRGAELEAQPRHPDHRHWREGVEALATVAELPADLRGPVRALAVRARTRHPAPAPDPMDARRTGPSLEDSGGAHPETAPAAPESATRVVVRPPQPEPHAPVRVSRVPASGLPRPPAAPRVAVSAHAPRAAAPAAVLPVPASDLAIPVVAARVGVDPPRPGPVAPARAALVPAGQLPSPRADAPLEARAPRLAALLPPTEVARQLTRPKAALPVTVDRPRPPRAVPARATPVSARMLSQPEPASRAAVRAPRPRIEVPAVLLPVAASDLAIPVAAARVEVDPPIPKAVVPARAAPVPAGQLPRPQSGVSVTARAPSPDAAAPVRVEPPRPQSPVHARVLPVPVLALSRPQPESRTVVEAPRPVPLAAAALLPPTEVAKQLIRPRAALPVTVDRPRPPQAVPARATPVSARMLPQPEPASRAAVRAPRPRIEVPAVLLPAAASGLAIPVAAARVEVDPPIPKAVVPARAAPVPAGQLPRPQSGAPVAARAPSPGAAPQVQVDAPRPQSPVPAQAPVVPVLALPQPEPESRVEVRVPGPRIEVPAAVLPVAASDLAIPVAAARVEVDPPIPKAAVPARAAPVPVGQLPRPRADAPLEARAPRRAAAVPAEAPVVPVLALPQPEPESRVEVRAPRPRTEVPAAVLPVATSGLAIPVAAARVEVDSPIPKAVVSVPATPVPAGKLTRPRANRPVAVRAPWPEAAARPEAAPRVQPPAVAARHLPRPEAAAGVSVDRPRPRPRVSVTAPPGHRVWYPGRSSERPAPPPRDPDAADAEVTERQRQRLIAEAEADWLNTARGVLERDMPRRARKIAKAYLEGNPYCHPFSSTTLYWSGNPQDQNACRCAESAIAAGAVLGPVLERIAHRHFGGPLPPAVRDHWWHQGADQYKRDQAIAAAMAEWESVAGETIGRMVEAAVPGDVRHLRDRLGGKRDLDARVRALTASPHPRHERGRDRGRGPGYGY